MLRVSFCVEITSELTDFGRLLAKRLYRQDAGATVSTNERQVLLRRTRLIRSVSNAAGSIPHFPQCLQTTAPQTHRFERMTWEVTAGHSAGRLPSGARLFQQFERWTCEVPIIADVISLEVEDESNTAVAFSAAGELVPFDGADGVFRTMPAVNDTIHARDGRVVSRRKGRGRRSDVWRAHWPFSGPFQRKLLALRRRMPSALLMKQYQKYFDAIWQRQDACWIWRTARA